MKSKQQLTALLKCTWYFLWILLGDAFWETLGKECPEKDTINQAWKNKDEEFLRYAFLKQLNRVPIVILFFTTWIVTTILLKPNNLLNAALQILSFISLFVALVVSPLIFLWKSWQIHTIANYKESRNTGFVSLLVYILPEEACEEWLGDLQEWRCQLIDRGYPQWQVTIAWMLQLTWSLLLIKFQYVFSLQMSAKSIATKAMTDNDPLLQPVKESLFNLVINQKLMGRQILVQKACRQFSEVNELQVDQVIQQLCKENRIQILNPSEPPESQVVCLRSNYL